jgi:hypothetical protein
MNTRIFKSIAAVMIGAGVGIFLSIGTDAAMRALGIFPVQPPMKNSLFVLATIYRTFYGVIAAYITARIAPDKPMMHALVLGSLGLVACAAGAIATWNKMPALGPKWYPLALIVLAIPPAWAGAKLRLMQLRERSIPTPNELPSS